MSGSPLSPTITAIIVLVIAFLLVVNVLADIWMMDYEGTGTSLMLGGLIGGALGLDRIARGGGKE